MPKRTVILLGATGLVGSHLLQGLLAADFCGRVITLTRSPVTADGERGWFVGYGIAAFIYRMFVLAALALFVSTKFFFIGVIIALWALCTQIVLPAVRNSSRLYNSIGGRRRRKRFVLAATAMAFTPSSGFAPAWASLPWITNSSRLAAGARV